MKPVILSLVMLFASVLARADVPTVIDSGKVADIPAGMKTCMLAVDDNVSVTVACDDKIRINTLTDITTQSRASTIASYTMLLSAKGLSLKSCFTNPSIGGATDTGISTSIVNYCIFQH